MTSYDLVTSVTETDASDCMAASAVPMALVPAPPSLQSVPSAKFIESAACMRTLGLPSTHSRIPLASETTMR